MNLPRDEILVAMVMMPETIKKTSADFFFKREITPNSNKGCTTCLYFRKINNAKQFYNLISQIYGFNSFIHQHLNIKINVVKFLLFAKIILKYYSK